MLTDGTPGLLTGAQKMWAAFIIGTLVQSLTVVLLYLPEDVGNVRIYLMVLVGITGTIGQGLGVYAIANKP